MAQVIIVSNRLPISVKKVNAKLVFSPSIGGLATGLSSYANDPENSWIGWPGIPSDELTDNEKQQITEELAKHNSYPVFLSKKQIDNFYNGYSNSILWPRFHGLSTKRVSSEKLNDWWQAYRKVNQKFMEAVLNLAEPKSQIWIHDYQLMLLPEMLRKENMQSSIGFFLHIPFPEWKTFSRLPEGKRLLNGMLGADLIGFHTSNYVQNFMQVTEEADVGTRSDDHINLTDRSVRVSDFPMGIDYEKYAAAGKSKEVRKAVRRYKKKYGRLRLIVSVDRLDPTKGLEERMNAYNALLEANPKLLKRVVFAMIVAPSRTDISTYEQLGKKLEGLAQDINSKYGTSKWLPIDYINVSQPFEEVTALFQIADVAFITPLKDGMNLAAKEFVASNHRHGVLILSDTAGASEELQDAIIVNPRDQSDLVSALEKALSMHKKELRARLNRMKKDISIHTVQFWAQNFIDTLQQPIPDALHFTRTITAPIKIQMQADYAQAKKRLLLLDYDGSLVPFTKDYRDATPPASLIKLLTKFCDDDRNEIVIISGRSSDDLDAWFGSLRVNLVAEHGAAKKTRGAKSWQLLEKSGANWKQLLMPVLEKYARLTPGAKVEVKPHSLVWHYRDASTYHAQKYAVIIKHTLKPILKNYKLELVQGNKVLEIKNPTITKANAARPWLLKKYGFELTIGDDVTDESIFQVLSEDSYSIKVGRGRTAARFRLTSSKKVLSLLESLLGP